MVKEQSLASLFLKAVGETHGCSPVTSWVNRSAKAKKVSPKLYCRSCNKIAIKLAKDLNKLFAKRVLDHVTHDRVAYRMISQGFNPNKCSLGDVMCAVRKELTKHFQEG